MIKRLPILLLNMKPAARAGTVRVWSRSHVFSFYTMRDQQDEHGNQAGIVFSALSWPFLLRKVIRDLFTNEK
jgi:hypothetical protein